MTLKTLFTGAAAVTAIGGAALGVTSVVAPLTASAQPACASSGQLRSVIDGLLAPGVPARTGKSDLVEGGIGRIDGAAADSAINNAYAKGSLPVAFDVAEPVCNGAIASTTLSANGQSLAATFVPGGRFGYVLSRNSAVQALSLFG